MLNGHYRAPCYVCDRWGTDMVMVAPSYFRHAACYPGSAAWLEYYAALPVEKHTEAGNCLYHAKASADITDDELEARRLG